MKQSNKLFVIWGVLVVAIVALLTVLGFMLENKNKEYLEIEKKLSDSAKKYVDFKFLYPEDGKTTTITKDELIKNEYLDELKHGDEVCDGYVKIKKDGVYKYDAYIKCKDYKTSGYKK